MQDKLMSRWLSPLMAFCLSFIVIAVLAPLAGIQSERQIDFWLLWFGVMFILALPIVYLEIALAKRSKTTALNALMSLTRDADVSQKWRWVGWAGAFFIPFLAGGLLYSAATSLSLSGFSSVGLEVLYPIFVVAAIALSFVPRLIIVVLSFIAVLVTLVLGLNSTQDVQWQWTAIEFSEWGAATILALVANGLGLGLYWQSSLVAAQQSERATHTAWPIWIAQLVAVIAFAYFSVTTAVSGYALIIALITVTALLLNLVREQLIHRQLAVVVQWAMILVALLVWCIPQSSEYLYLLLALLGLGICLIYALFAGWMMKISHLRKSMNFGNEAIYNLWRIAIRIILPLSIVVAIISIVGKFFA